MTRQDLTPQTRSKRQPVAMPDRARLFELLRFDWEAGKAYWRKKRGSKAAGSIAGCTAHHGYKMIRIDDRLYLLRRIIYFAYHGVDPGSSTLDHADRNPSNNSINNLRIPPNGQSSQTAHQGIRSDNTTGATGVYLIKGKWRCCVSKEGQHFWSQSFTDKQEAITWQVNKKRQLYGVEWMGENAKFIPPRFA